MLSVLMLSHDACHPTTWYRDQVLNNGIECQGFYISSMFDSESEGASEDEASQPTDPLASPKVHTWVWFVLRHHARTFLFSSRFADLQCPAHIVGDSVQPLLLDLVTLVLSPFVLGAGDLYPVCGL